MRNIASAHEDDWRQHVVGIDAVINTVGILRERGADTYTAVHAEGPAAMFRACTEARVPRLIHVSAIGADIASPSAYLRTKGQAEATLDHIAAEHSGIAVTVLRASLVYGPGGASTALFAALAAMPVTAIPADANQSVQPVHVDDMAEAIIQLLETSAPWPRHLDIVGPNPLSYGEMLAAYRRWLGMEPAPALTVPAWAMATVAWIGEAFTNAPVTRDTLHMLRAGNVGDVAPLSKLLGRMPLPLAEGLSRHPASDAERRQARLYTLVRPLRWSLAFLWIFSAIVSLASLSEGEALLSAAGLVNVQFAPLIIFAAAGLNIAIGVTLLHRRYVVAAGLLSITTIAAYTGIITVALPEYWLHPFAPVAKNIPLVLATLATMAWEA